MRLTLSNSGKTVTIYLDNELFKYMTDLYGTAGELRFNKNSLYAKKTKTVKLLPDNINGYKVRTYSNPKSGGSITLPAYFIPDWPHHGKLSYVMDRETIAEASGTIKITFEDLRKMPKPQCRYATKKTMSQSKLIMDTTRFQESLESAKTKLQEYVALETSKANCAFAVGAKTYLFKIPSEDLFELSMEFATKGYGIKAE